MGEPVSAEFVGCPVLNIGVSNQGIVSGRLHQTGFLTDSFDGFCFSQFRVCVYDAHCIAQVQGVGKTFPFVDIPLKDNISRDLVTTGGQSICRFAEFFQEILVYQFLFVVGRFYVTGDKAFTRFEVRAVAVHIRQYGEKIYFINTGNGVDVHFPFVILGLVQNVDNVLDECRVHQVPCVSHFRIIFAILSAIVGGVPVALHILCESSQIEWIGLAHLPMSPCLQLNHRQLLVRVGRGRLGRVCIQFLKVGAGSQQQTAYT